MALRFVDQVELENKVVIARFDFNVPLNKDDKSHITDTTRIDSALDTIKYILESGAKKLILMSHLGRPKGKVNMDFSLEPVATYLAKALNDEVLLTESCLDRGIKTLLDLSNPRIILLQNLRFHPEEEENDPDFSKALASYADIYINDAFGTSHRKHASTYGITKYFNEGQKAGGFLLKKKSKHLRLSLMKRNLPILPLLVEQKLVTKLKS